MFISYIITVISNMYTPITNNFYKEKKNHTDTLNAAAEAQDHVVFVSLLLTGYSAVFLQINFSSKSDIAISYKIYQVAMKQSPQKSQSKLEKTTLLLQYFCNLKNFFRLHFSTIQAKIHIQSHSIFIYFFFSMHTWLSCFASSVKRLKKPPYSPQSLH